MMFKYLKLDIFIKLGAFYSFSWAIHIILISIVSFFHFRLGHRLMVIENWIYDFSWVVLLLSKTFAIGLYLRYFSNERFEGRFLKYIKEGVSIHRPLMYVIPILCTIFLIYYIDPSKKIRTNFEFIRTFIHMISIVITFSIDLIFLHSHHSQSESWVQGQRDKIEWGELIGCSIMSYFYFKLIVPYANYDLYIFNLIFTTFAFYYFSRELSFPISFVAIVIAPIYGLFGFDPIWSKEYSYFDSQLTSLNIQTSAIMIALLTYYIFEFKKRSTR